MTVYLVGAGPGDPGLITVKGRDLLQRADAVIYDRLVDECILALMPAAAEQIYVGKEPSHHHKTQDEINDLLVDAGRRHETVVRLKGGDPFVFGRGGEEAEVLARAGIPFEVVPGITSAIAAPAYAGIPVTHRHSASTVTFITGHEDPAKPNSSINWQALASLGGTLVFLMGVERLQEIADRLIRAGLPSDTPAAVIRHGTRPEQQTVTAALSDLPAAAAGAGIRPPAVTVVGAVVAERDRLQWFERRPLLGRTVLITRAREQASELAARLEALGARCMQFPVIAFEAPPSDADIQAALSRLDAFHWIMFTSANGVAAFFRYLGAAGQDARALAGAKTAAIGPGTAEALARHGIRADLVPERFVAEGLIEALAEEPLEGRNILIPRAAEARDLLPDALSRRGATVTVAPVYRTVIRTDGAGAVAERIRDGGVAIITFTSSSTVRHFHDAVGSALGPDLQRAKIACIGPITADTARQLGYRVDAVAEEHTMEGLTRACLALANSAATAH